MPIPFLIALLLQPAQLTPADATPEIIVSAPAQIVDTTTAKRD